MHKCKYCNKEFSSGQRLGGHINNCDYNPNIKIIRRKRKEQSSKNAKGRKLSDKTKKKISESRIKYLKENPDKVPYKINHSSCISYPEKIFKEYLEKNNIKGWIHQMQFSLYQIDFAFPEYKLAVEIDGYTHTLDKVKKIDKKRDLYLKEKGWKTLRISTKKVKNNVYECINIVLSYLEEKMIEIPEDFLNSKYLKEEKERIKILEKEKREKEKQNKIRLIKQNILESDIDFSKIGWVGKVSSLIGISSGTTKRWMLKNMPDFYDNCYKMNRIAEEEIEKKCLKCNKITTNKIFCSVFCSRSYQITKLNKERKKKDL